ncbi:MAG TPA: MAPEG family protein [Paraburkholderia sp.]|uniref:MAPEG family protein n=1 Tax=Paraburkholderia sp. TaxID=1926495 RepID=UPI002C62BC10|nr:MAPEG family protein [Paraburkholderia sp.]HTR05860.1 MAPEG family protein [Paraburkholderia sp.]
MSTVPLVCVAVLGLLVFGLGLAISAARFRGPMNYGMTNPSDFLYRLVRAHGNTVEFVPFLALLFLYFAGHQPSTTTLALIIAATICRCLLVIGLLAWPTMARPNPARFVGALGTYLCGGALCVALLL